MLTYLSEKLGAKFPATKRGYSMAKIVCLDDAFLGVFGWEVSPVENQSLQQKDKKRERGKEKTKSLKTAHVQRKKVIKPDASGKKGMLSWWRCHFE